MSIDELLKELTRGNSKVILNGDCSKILNEFAVNIYNDPNKKLNNNEIEDLKKFLMCCNILYNRTDLEILPVEDGVYDLLLEKYKEYDNHFQVGSAVVEFKSLIDNDPNIVKITNPLIFRNRESINDVRDDIYDKVNDMGGYNYIDKRDILYRNPLVFSNQYISKRTHNTEHNHPQLVGTLDKCKFVLNSDAINAGVYNDPNVKILERDFFQKHVSDGLLDPNKEFTVVLELKYDGISVEADCDCEVESARSRGDTGIGVASDMTPILKGYSFKHAKSLYGEKPIGVKFEAIIKKSNMMKFNAMRKTNYKNCRTAIIGLFGASDGYKYRDLITLVPLAVDRDQVYQISNRIEEIEFCNTLFVSDGEPLRYYVASGNLQQILYITKQFLLEVESMRNELDFMYDGIVVSYLDEDIRNKLGRENFINKYSMAVKFNPYEKITTFRGYSFEVGQHGTITPMIHYDPVEFIGTIHTKSTGSSYERFKNMGLRIGDYIKVTYTNDVIPYVSTIECSHNDDNKVNPKVEFPTTCPICGTKIVFSDSKKSAICPNINCGGRTVRRMTNMFSKLNIKGFAESTFTLLYNNGVCHFKDLYNDNIIMNLETIIGEADGLAMRNELLKLKDSNINDYMIIGSLGFTSLGYKKWQLLLQYITIKELNSIDKNNLYSELSKYSSVQGIGSGMINTIVNEYEFFRDDIEFIINNIKYSDTKGKSKDIKGIVRFTGVRNSELSSKLSELGYDADDNGSVTKKTNILIVPYQGFTSTKTNKVSDSCIILPIDKANEYFNL